MPITALQQRCGVKVQARNTSILRLAPSWLSCLFKNPKVIGPLGRRCSVSMSTIETGQANAEIDIRKEGKVAVLTMLDQKNKINSVFCRKWMQALDEIERWDVDALVTTGVGKFYSFGFDSAYLVSAGGDERKRFWQEFVKLSTRMMQYPMVTISAMNGHCVAAGVVLSLMHDYRVQQKNRGWIYMSEIDMGVPLPPFVKAVMQSKLTPKMIRDVYVYGKRFNADMSFDIGLVDKISEEDDVVETSIDYAKTLTENGRYKQQNLYQIKKDIYGDAVFDDSDVVVPQMDSLPKL